MSQATPKQCDHAYHYYLATNEDGWRCCSCNHKPGEPPGYSPQLDREMIVTKVYGIQGDMHDADLIRFSNGSEGDGAAEMVADRCRNEGRYDQYSIILFTMELVTHGHAKYWKEVSDAIIAGKDTRDRCSCGELSTSSSNSGPNGSWVHRCSKCATADWRAQ